MALQLYNVRTRSKEPFVPRQDGKVGVYICGLTVYDHAHLGHARTAVSFEVIRRWLERSYDTTFVQNVTDVDDKIIHRAKELGVSPRQHAKTWDKACSNAMARLGVRAADEEPHVTANIGPIIAFIRDLIAKGYAYATDMGNVYFDVANYQAYATSEFPDQAYGAFSGRKLEEMKAGTRKEMESDKRSFTDFALWKRVEEDAHPDASWPSPWGKGRPGWHIECSVMSTKALGDQFDIHGGGQDLIFPHHENEIAQSQACTGKAPFANVWLHTGFLNVDGQKMSKSLGNFIVLEELLDELEAQNLGPDVLRYYFLRTHYRSKIDFSRTGLMEAADSLQGLERTRSYLHGHASHGPERGEEDAAFGTAIVELEGRFQEAMDDDIHTPTALAVLFELRRLANDALDRNVIGASAAALALTTLEELGGYLTLLQGSIQVVDVPAAVEALVQERETARETKDWARSDALRDEIRAQGFVVEDTSNGPRLSPL